MSCCAKKIFALALTGLMFLSVLLVQSSVVEGEPIGSITAIEGEGYILRKGNIATLQAILGSPIYLYDHILTEKDSRVQILFQDESLLNLAENTTIEITEYIYAPEENRRSAVITLLMGRVRGVVGRSFAGPGSQYTICTPNKIIEVEKGHYIVDAASR
jgi:hypothetical protein